MPVSSTVIPLPIYQVGYGIDIVKGSKGQKTVIQKPEGPVTLVTGKNLYSDLIFSRDK